MSAYLRLSGKILVHVVFAGHQTEHIPDPEVEDQEHI